MWSDHLFACSVCFGAADGPMLTAARLGVLVMVGVTCAMLAGFAVFFVRLARAGNGDSPRFSPTRKWGQPPFSRTHRKRGQPPFGDSPRLLGKKGTA